ncbi:MAG TPA: FAD-dependent monooxygenase [Casimicrobiaceae bacterium]|nr:FAD-dependent monooxygenase [Casimicrobiaceae bacterium]
MDIDVLIVGAGPTGLMLANQLGRRGIRAMIIDRHSGPAQQTRAMAVQARTLEIYAKLGIAERALELGTRAVGANMWTQGRRTARIPLGEIGEGLSPFPFVLMLGQDENERILGERLRDWGVDVQWNTELVALQQHADHVEAGLKQPDGTTRKLQASHVAGCDGARSAVRELSSIGFPGAPYEHVFFVADTEAVGPMVPDELNVYLWRDGFHLFFPMPGQDRWRVIGIVPKSLRGRADLAFDELIPAIRQEAGADLSFRHCDWFSTYHIHHRSAERFRDRRCFLLGDAAHIHSPIGGQGMNTGLQDAYNFAWKLALVLDGRADPALLDTYETERVPVAERLLQTTDRAFTLVVSDHWIAGLLRTRVIARVAAFAMRFERVRKLAFRTISQIGIRYPKSALSLSLAGLPENAPHAGDRFPSLRLKFKDGAPVEDLFEQLDDTRFNLIVIGQTVGADAFYACGDLLRVHEIPNDPIHANAFASAGIPQPSFYLLRPDGHVGLAGTRLDVSTVLRYFKDHGLRFDVTKRATNADHA